MREWEKSLAEKLETKPATLRPINVIGPGGALQPVVIREITVPVGLSSYQDVCSLHATVNAEEVAGIPPGCVCVTGYNFAGSPALVTFGVIASPQGADWGIAYTRSDFGVIPDPPTTPPGSPG